MRDGQLGGLAIWTAHASWDLAAGSFDPFVGGRHGHAAAPAILEGLIAVAISLAILAWFQRRWDRAGPISRRAGSGDYAAYLLHPLVLVWLSVLARHLPVPSEVKWVLVGSAGVVAAFAAGYAISTTRASTSGVTTPA